MTREDIVRSMFRAEGFGLEIGPSYNPLLPKAQGFNVEILDYASQADLVEKYRNEGAVDTARIEPVDHVCDGRSYVETIGAKARYDFIVASHVIEHSADLIGFLRDCEELLKPDGVLVLAIPDKRYCFDVLRPVSTTGAALQAHQERRTRHAPGLVFDHLANAASRAGEVNWRETNRQPLRLDNSVAEARRHYEAARTGAGYVDTHGWCFTPSSFRLLLGDFNGLGLLGLREQSIRTTNWFEFFVVLARNGAGCPLSRLELLVAIEAELAAASDKILAPAGRLASLTSALVPDEARPGETEGRFGTSQARDAYLETILSSTSWRITRPLRILASLARRFRPKP